MSVVYYIYKNTLRIVNVKAADGSMYGHSVPGGFFMETAGEDFTGLKKIISSHCQTICTYGVDRNALGGYIAENGLKGGDRIVPVGSALEFSLTWDGINIINAMSRKVEV